MKTRRPGKPFWEMNTAELREATREFDAEHVGDLGKPLTRADKQLLTRARRRGKDAPVPGEAEILISIERELLKKADAAARKLHLTRSELIARALRSVLKRAG